MPGGTVLALLLFYWQRRGGLQAIRRDVQRVLWRLARLSNKLVRGSNPGAMAWTWRDVGDGVRDRLAQSEAMPVK